MRIMAAEKTTSAAYISPTAAPRRQPHLSWMWFTPGIRAIAKKTETPSRIRRWDVWDATNSSTAVAIPTTTTFHSDVQTNRSTQAGLDDVDAASRGSACCSLGDWLMTAFKCLP